MTRPLVRIVLGCLAALTLTFFNQYLGVWVRLPKSGSLASHFVSVGYLLPILFALLTLARGAATLERSAGFLVIVGLLCAAPMATVFALGQFKVNPPLWLALTANNLFGPLGMVLIGAALGRILKHSNTLLVAAGFGLFFDFVVVTLGPVAQLLNGGNASIIAAVSVGAGAPRTDLPSARSIPLLSSVTIGPADVLFLAFFLSAVFILQKKESGELQGGAHPGSERRTYWWMFCLLSLALVLVEFTALPVPALAPMGIAVLIANARNAAFTKREKRDLGIGAIFAVFCAALIVWSASRLAGKPGYGLSLQLATNGARRFVMVTDVADGSTAQNAGIKKNDLILQIDGKRASQLPDDEIKKKLGETSEKGVTLLAFTRGQRPRLVALVGKK
jgi:hypothetical protein